MNISIDSIPDFVIEETSNTLISEIDNGVWRNDLKRRVQHYGYRYDYRARSLDRNDYLGSLPDWLCGISDRLVSDGLFKTKPDQVIVNEYQPGQGISPHIDCIPCFGDVIASLSLGSGCEMAFDHASSGKKAVLYLEPNSLLVLRDETRYEWRHSIAARKSDIVDGIRRQRGRRVSLTFRTVIVTDV